LNPELEVRFEIESNLEASQVPKKLSGDVLLLLSVWSEVQIFSYGPADATATRSSLAVVKSRMVDLSGAGSPRLSWRKRPLNGVVVVSYRCGTSFREPA